MVHIAVNAHLLAPGDGYRRAGIHRYMYGVLRHLPAVDETLTYTVMLNHHLDYSHPRQHERLGMFNTAKPAQRIVWEQLVQPWALRQLQPDLYHGLAFVQPVSVPCPSVVTVYDLSFERYPEVLSGLRRRYLQAFTKYSCQHATRIISISESTKRDLVELWQIDPAKIDIAYPGVGVEFRRLPTEQVEAFRRAKGLPQRFWFFVGTFEPRKNLPLLIEAYGQLPPAVREEVHLVLGGGKGWMYDDIFARSAAYPTIHTPGYIPAEELVLWYNAAEAFLYPTLYEGFGIPIVEALACGTPVVASNSSSLPEAAGEVGILLPPDDPPAWTATLETLANQPAVVAETGPAWAARFTWQHAAQQTVESYRKCR